MTRTAPIAVIGMGPRAPLSPGPVPIEVVEATMENAGYDPARPPGALAVHDTAEAACLALALGICDLAITVSGPSLGAVAERGTAIALRRLDDALLDGDLVRAVIETATDPAADPALDAVVDTATTPVTDRGADATTARVTDRGAGTATGPMTASRPGTGPARSGPGGRSPTGGPTARPRDPLTVQDGFPPVHLPADRRPRVVAWSGRHRQEADAVREGLAGFFATLAPDRFADAVAVLQRGRTPHPVRGAIVATTPAEASAALVAARTASAEETAGHEPPSRDAAWTGVRFVFPAGGAGRLGASLYGVERLFSETMDVCLEAFERHGVDFCDAWLAGERDDDPVTFAVTYSLAATLTGWGVTPGGCTGEGVGEFTAAAFSGTLELDEAIARVAASGAAPERVSGHAFHEVEARRGTVAGPEASSEPAAGPKAGGAHGAPSLLLGAAAGISPGEETIRCGDDRRGLLTALARLWTLGCPVDWVALDPDHPLQRLPVPGGHRPAEVTPVPVPAPEVRERENASPAPEARERESASRLPEGLPEPAEPLRRPEAVPYSFWVLEQLAGSSGVSNLAVAFRTRQPLRRLPLQIAVNRLLKRHPALRLRFPEVDGAPVRHLTAPKDAQIKLVNGETTPETLVADLQRFLDEPFDLGRDLLFRAGHFALPDGGGSVVCLVAHHIVIDATSMQFLVEELGGFYDAQTSQEPLPAALAGTAPMLEPKAASRESLDYWLDKLRDVDPAAMVLPGSRPSPARPTFAGHTCSWEVDADTRRALDTLRTGLRTTDNIVLAAAFMLTLRAHGAGPELVAAMPVTTRTAAMRGHVGYGVSTLPIRVRADSEEGFAALVRRVEDVFFEGVEHADASVEAVLVERGHGTGDWRVPLFRHMFNYRPWTDDQVSILGSVPEYVEDLFDRSRLDLQCIAVQEPGRLTLRVWHSTEVHDEAEIAAFVARMTALLRRAAKDAHRPQRELDSLSADDRRLLDRLNDTARTWEGPATLLERIVTRTGSLETGDGQVGRESGAGAAIRDGLPEGVRGSGAGTVIGDGLPGVVRGSGDQAVIGDGDPEATREPRTVTAIRDGDREVTYGELLDWAASVRDTLVARGAGPGDIVALGLSRSAEMVAAVLGVWAAGAAYLPLDPRQPELRLAYQVEDCGARLVVADSEAPWAGETPVLPMPQAPASGAEADQGPRRPLDAAEVSATISGESIAYVIYTSGSTGRPKGVAVTHGNLANLVLDFADRLGAGAADAVLWSTTTSFDISALELMLPLTVGGTLVVASDDDQLQPRRFLELIAARDVRVVQATPTAWRLIAPEARDELAGRVVLCGGEPMPAALATDLLGLGCRLFNVYGPTETTIWSTAAEILGPPADPVPIGVPLANTRIFVRGADGREAPPGVPGELCVAGDGVSAGYVNRPELTAERFGEHPRHGRFYRTGDMARLRHDATLELLGRDDRQIKLRGHRIELGEIEAVLHHHDAVKVAAVIVHDERLVAFVQPTDPPDGETEAALREELWRYAGTRLPDYAVPSGIVLAGEFPTTANGKIDYRGLTVPEDASPSAPGAPASSELAEGVLRLWREALRRPGLGEHDNFFLNGGHSVLAVRLIAPLEELAGRAINVRAVFDHPTPAELAAFIQEGTGS
ncbi:amino acid adenylation domain-containing protein [Streptosporangium sp. NPDC000509]|uniref:amino acid adenylation domain-containing protein n=1 Tax=Streptosporangium sp. NPDC000509 TaxID=3366186 RepID=UPI00369E8160